MLSELSFIYPWALAVFPMLIFLKIILSNRSNLTLVNMPDSALVVSGSFFSFIKRFLLIFSHLTFIGSLSLGVARPVVIKDVTPENMDRRDIFLALDLSKSMEARDFRSSQGLLSRMDGVKSVTAEFIKKRPADRIGLVVFGSNSFLQAPLTSDHILLSRLITQLRSGIAGDGTAIGDGLGLALKKLQELPENSRAVILLTDGVSNSGSVEPLKAAQIAKDLKVKVYTIGIGSKHGSTVTFGSGFFQQQIRAEFDEETLKRIAEMTNGKYFFASDSSELDTIYREIDQIERRKDKEESFQRRTEYYPLLAVIALISIVFHFVLSQTFSRVLP